MRQDLPTGTVTFLFTDVEGSTRLLHEIGADRYAEALAEHRSVIREACAAEGGVEVDTQGDAFFFAFATAPGALAAASAFTDALREGPIQVRAGIHTGTPLLTREGYVGDDLHRAARIAAAGHGGQVLVSAATQMLVDSALVDLGEHRFKDLATPERVYQLGDGAFPGLKSLYRTNLPVPVTAFLGREQELATVTELLGREDVRLVTLTGPGGIGKTRLALQAGAKVAELFPDGVFWVPLAALRDPALVLPSVADVLEVTEQAGHSPLETLEAQRADKRVLLLLDNAEHLLPAAAGDVGSLLAAIPSITIVVTSRERLRIEGEHTYPVPTLNAEDGEDLFLARARALDPTFSPGDGLEQLCERLDNVPLALELAAARTGLLSTDQLLERLGERLDLLTGHRDADPRQQTLRATISWSYDLLSLEEQKAFACMSVFSGGCTLDAAQQVCECDVKTLESLLDKSLVRRRDGATGPRLWMLETIRQFAAEQLAARAASDGAARRHLDHYVALAQPLSEQSRDTYDFDGVEAELDNFRGALDTALVLDPGRAIELVVCLGTYWMDRGPFSEGRARTEAALAAATNVPPSARARALRISASLASKQQDLDAAERLGRESLRLYREHHDRRGAAAVLNVLGIVAWYRGDLIDATRLLEEALSEYDAAAEDNPDLVDEQWLSVAQLARANLVAVASARGDHAKAIATGREIVTVARGGDAFALVVALNALGLALEATGETEEARECFEEGIALSRSHGFTEALAYVLASLAHLECAASPSTAYEHYRESLALMHDMGESRGVAYCLEGLGAVALSEGDAVRTAMLLAAAGAIRESAGTPLDPAELAEVEARTGQAADALGVNAFESAWSEGRRLTRDQVVELALGVTASP